MSFEKDLADFLHKLVDGLTHGERIKQDLHTELAANTVAPEPEKGEGETGA